MIFSSIPRTQRKILSKSSSGCWTISCSVSWRNALSTSVPPNFWGLSSYPTVWPWILRNWMLCMIDPYPRHFNNFSTSWALPGISLSGRTFNTLSQFNRPSSSTSDRCNGHCTSNSLILLYFTAQGKKLQGGYPHLPTPRGESPGEPCICSTSSPNPVPSLVGVRR